jgi:hypothetical protein
MLRINERDVMKMNVVLHVKYPYSCPILIKLETSGQAFEKYSNIKFHKNPSRVRRVADGQTDEANNRFSQFFERGYKLVL